ncbi:MAG: hypothetical protein IT307_10465 [Chloroflexi bacterium]|nr:hypothetical protein [Chloroflexota bacterium]
MIDTSQLTAGQSPADRHWLTVSQAALELGVPERVIYRRVATQTMRATRAPDGALLVAPDASAPGQAGLELEAVDPNSIAQDRTRSLAEMAGSIVEPLVNRLAQQEETIRQQAEELGKLRAQVEVASAARARLAPLLETQSRELAALRSEVERLSTPRRSWWPF